MLIRATRIFLTFSMLFALSAIPQSAVSQTNRKNATIIIGSPGFIYTLHYIAVGARLFQDEGLDIETIQVPSGPQQVAAILGRSAVAAPTNMEHVVRSFARGSDMVAISRIYDVIPYVLVLSNKAIAKAGITDAMPIDEKLKRLKGLKIGVTSVGSGTDSFLRSLFIARGAIPDKEITIMPLGSADGMLTAMEHGIIDGFSFIPPDSEIPAQKGYGKVVIDPITGEVPELKNVPYMAVTTSRETLSKEKTTLLSITRAYTRAMKLLQDNPTEGRRFVRQYLTAPDDQTFNATFDKYISALPKDPTLTQGQIDNMVSWMNLSASTPLHVKYDDIVQSDLAETAAKDILKK